MKRLRDFKLSIKFMASIGLVLFILTVFDVWFSMKKEKDIMLRDVKKWTFIFAENVRTTLNTLMRNDKMDIRFEMLDTMAKEIKGLRNVRVIRGPKVNEIFRKVEEEELLPMEREAIEDYKKEISRLKKDLWGNKDSDEIKEIKDEIAVLQQDIRKAEDNITKMTEARTTDEREMPKDDLDKEVIKKGEPIYHFEGDMARVLIPYKAQKSCSKASGCHTYAREGDILGAISMEFSIEDIRREIAVNNVTTAGIGVARFGIILGMLALFLMVFITKNISIMLAGFRRLTDGDFSKRLPIVSDDEMGELAQGFNYFIDTFNKMIREIQDAAKKISLTSEVLTTSSAQIVNDSESQMSRTTQVASASEELSATINEVSQSTFGAAEAARGADEVAKKGGVIVEKAVDGMNTIVPIVNDSSAIIAQFGIHSKEIGKIIGVINGIADQTNLLALNAAIEAARAGEQGKGFAVVANEVKKLAERTMTATKEIGSVIKAIQNNIDRAISSTKTEAKAVEDAVKYAREAGGALGEIIAHVENVTAIMQQIAVASEEQSKAASQISEDIDAVADVSKNRVKEVNQIANEALDLSNLSKLLEEMISKFKTD